MKVDICRNSFVCAAGAVLAVTLVGCAVGTSEHDRKYYLLEAVRQGPAATGRSEATLRVRRFDVDTAFAGKGLVYRISEFQYESDHYHEFLIPPGIMIAEQTRDWLVNSGLFRRVLPVRSPLESTYLLEGNVTALYGDFTNKAAPQAVMEIRFFLVGPPDAGETVMFAQTYRAVTPVPARTAEAFIGTLSRGLAEILTRMEADLQKALAERPAEPAPVVPSPES